MSSDAILVMVGGAFFLGWGIGAAVASERDSLAKLGIFVGFVGCAMIVWSFFL